MKRIITALMVAAFAAVFGLGIAATAHAAPGSEVCSEANPKLCFNVKGADYRLGGTIIAWGAGTNNNAFVLDYMVNLCGVGKVNPLLHCPFESQQLNDRYAGDWIYEVRTLGHQLCIGTKANGAGQLTTCPDENGNGGGPGTYEVQSSTNYLVNVYWSNIASGTTGNEPRWACLYTQGSAALLDYPMGEAGNCQFTTIP